MNLPYFVILLNGIDNITSYVMLNTRAIEINPFQIYFINNIGLLKFQIIEFIVFGILVILSSYFLYRRSVLSYYVLNGILLGGFLVTVLNNTFLILK